MSHPSTAPFSEREPIRLSEYFLALAAAILFVGILDVFTNSIPSRWNPPMYLDLARFGIFGNDHLVAPYAYRPGMPLLVRVISDALSISLEEGFLWMTRFMASAFFFAAFLLARCFTDSPWKAMIPALLVGVSAMHVKFPLFAPTAVEVAAFPLIVLSVWAFVQQRLWSCFFISALGLFFKEFLAIPLLMALREFALVYWRTRNPRNLLVLGVAVAITLGVVLVPRLFLRVIATEQEIDPIHKPTTLANLVLNPLDVLRDVNILFSIVAYWLPCFLLLTRKRLSEINQRLKPVRGFILGFLGLNLLLVMYGGTNIGIFVSYSAPIQLILLAALIGKGMHPAEWALALVCALLYNRAFSAIPVPDKDLDALIDFYGGWDSRVNLSTLMHSIELALYFFAMAALRYYLFRERAMRKTT